MSKEINFMFNTHKIYKKSFLDEVYADLNNVIVNDENFLVYKKNALEIMIDKSGPVYISGEVQSDNSLNNFIISAVKEYDNLNRTDIRFEYRYPFKIISPKDITNSIKSSLSKLNYNYIQNEMLNNDSLQVYLN